MEGRPTSLIRQIFTAALDVSSRDLPKFLASACGGDPALQAEVLSLIHSHRRTVHFFDPTVTAVDSADITPDPGNVDRVQWMLLDERPGSIIDRYKLIEVIGEGGHGVVFRVEQEQPVRRQVALKVIRKGMETDAVRLRFEAERQTLALLDHPNIAKLFDAGTTEQGRPYFAMELVAGIPITQFCDARKLPIRRRVELYITVCKAIHHAHQKGIIHRDLKPSNILVADADGNFAPKVIDFGIARVTSDSRSANEELQTFGTPQYMSPEQVAANPVAIDTRSDVYSLGAMLCELLAGVTAIDWDGRNIHTVQDLREIFATESPQPPSRRCLQNGAKDISDNRQVQPPALAIMLREDLDAIVLKAMQRDRGLRYDSVAALADDLQRYLDRRPVLALPPSAAYVFRRFCFRNKSAVVLSLAAVAALVAGLFIVATLLIRTRAAEATKSQAEATATENLVRAYQEQARAGVGTRVPGQRILSLRAIALAAQIKPSLELRNQAIACMTLVDVAPVDQWDRSKMKGAELTFAANADLYAQCEVNGTIRICRRSDRTQLCTLNGPGFSRGYDATFTSDGKYFAAKTARGPNGLTIWDLTTQHVVFPYPKDVQMDFNHRGDSFAIATINGDIEIHALPSNKLLKTIPGNGEIGNLRYRPGDDRLAVSNAGADLRIITIDSPASPLIIHTSLDAIGALAWHPNGQDIAVSGFSRMNLIEEYNADTGKLHTIMKGHIGTPVDLAYTNDGRMLLSGGWDCNTLVWDQISGLELLKLPDFGRSLRTYSRTDRFSLETGYEDQFWDLIRSNECRRFSTAMEDGVVLSADISPNRKLIASATVVGIRVWDIESGTQFCFLSVPAPRTVLFSTDGKRLLASTRTGVQSWSVSSLQATQDPSGDTVGAGSTSAMAMSHDGHTLFFGANDGTVYVGDPDHLSASLPLGRHTSPPRYAAITPNGLWAASCVRYEPTFKVWDLTAHKLAIELPVESQLVDTGSLAFSPDGKSLVVCDHESYRWYSVGDWKLINRLDRKNSTNPGLAAFSPDGKLVALAGHASSVILADPATGRELASLDTPATPNGPAFLAFSADSKQLIVTGGGVSLVSLWDIPLLRRELSSISLDWH